MSVLADFLLHSTTLNVVDAAQGGEGLPVPSPSHHDLSRSPLQATRFTPGPALSSSSVHPLRSILKGSLDARGDASGSPNIDAAGKSPLRASKHLTFSMDIARPFAEFGSTLKPQPDAVTGSLSPSGQRAVDRYRNNVTRLLGTESPLVDRNHFHHLAPLVRVARVGPADPGDQAVVRRPVDSLREGQVALLDQHVQAHMRECEALLGMPARTSKDPIGDKLAKHINEQRWHHHHTQEAQRLSHEAQKQEVKHTSPKQISKRFVTCIKPGLSETRVTGAEVIRKRREQREAAAALERLEKDSEVRRQKRILKALDDTERKAALYRGLIAEQDAARAERERGHVGAKMTPEELIAEWRLEVEDRVEDEEMEEEREKARSYRKAMRVEREEKRKADDLLSGLTSVQMEDKRRRLSTATDLPARKRWRITRMGSVDTFAVPRWSSRPLHTLYGDVVVEELDATIINHVTWIQTAQGWIPVQVAFNGMSRTQLFAEAPQDQGDGVVNTMLDALDDANEHIVDAMTMCPPEQLKSQVEVKEMLKQMEFTRQALRDLPEGRRDMIRRIWDAMQSSGKHSAQARRMMQHDVGE